MHVLLLQGGDDDDSDGGEEGPHCWVGLITCWDFGLIWVWLFGLCAIGLGFHGSAVRAWVLARLPWGGAPGAALAEPLLGTSGEHTPACLSFLLLVQRSSP